MKSKGRNIARNFYLMNKPGRWIVLVLLCLSSITASFAQPPAGIPVAGLRSGFGLPAPHARNISRDPRFAVYEWKVDGDRIFQINSSTGERLDVVTEAPDGYGPAQGISMSSRSHAPYHVQPGAGGGGRCPCSASVLTSVLTGGGWSWWYSLI